MVKKIIRVSLICVVLLFFLFSMLFVGYIKAEYPLAYYDVIKNEAINNSLDPVLVFAVVKAESDFNETAVSNKGAVGLMQLLPRTAESIAQSFGFDDYHTGLLFVPDLNIKLGCGYLKYLTNKFDNILEVLVAYNAGEGTLNKMKASVVNFTIEDVTIKETKNYVNKVFKYMKTYKKLYFNS